MRIVNTYSIFLLLFIYSQVVFPQEILRIINDRALLADPENIMPMIPNWTVPEFEDKIKIHILQTRKDQAVGQILSGEAQVSQKVIPLGNKTAGFLIGMELNSFSVKTGNTTYTETAALYGITTSIKAFYDHKISSRFFGRASAGLDGFSANYKAQDPVINTDGAARSLYTVSAIAFDYEFLWNIFTLFGAQAWIGPGYSLQYATSASTNLYQVNPPSFSNVITLGGGFNYDINSKWMIPLAGHLNYYIAENGATQFSLSGQVGFGWKF